MKIHHLLNEFNTGGAEMLVVAMAAEQMRAGHEVVVHAMSGEGPISQALRAAGVPFRTHLARHPAHRIWQVGRELRRDRPDVLHCHNLAPLIIGSVAAKLARVKVCVVTMHHPSKHSALDRKLWRAARLCDKVIACSDLVLASMQQDQFADQRKLLLIPNGAGEPNRNSNGDALAARNGVRFITVGRIVWEKDYPSLVKAFAIARQTIPALELWIVGDGIDRPKVEDAIRQFGQQDAITMLGMKQNVGFYLMQSDVFVMSSVSEGLPISQLEAMACGLPMIVTDAGGMPDVVRAANAGLVCPKSDPEALAHAMVTLASDPERRIFFGKNARFGFEQRFTIKRMSDEYEAVYRQCLISNFEIRN